MKRDQQGFTLLETVCALAITGLVAALALPGLPPHTSGPKLEALAREAASLLAADHAAAMHGAQCIDSLIDISRRSIRSGASRRSIALPDDVNLATVLAARCNGIAKGSVITFLPNGMSCGGTISLTREGKGFDIKVNWLTGGIDIATR